MSSQKVQGFGPGPRQSPDSFERFELEIERAKNGYRARVAASPVKKTGSIAIELSAFEPENPFRHDNSRNRGAEKRDSHRHVRSHGVDPDDLQDWGRRLFRATFVGELREVLKSSMQKVRSEGRGLRICLRLDDAPELAALPWEALGDALDDGVFGGDLDLLVARTLNVNRNRRPASAPEMWRGKVRMLGLLPCPEGETELSGASEWRELEKVLAEQARAGILETHLVDPPTLEELGREIDRAPCQILHIVAHGEPGSTGAGGSLLLETSTGEVDPVGGLQLKRALASRELPRLIVLNACYGAAARADDAFDGLAQSLLRVGVRAVVAMRTAISDAAALTFATMLYRELVKGRTIESAMSEARRALALGDHRAEWATPVLYLRGENLRILDTDSLAPRPESGPRAWLGRIGGGLVALALAGIGGWQVVDQAPPGTPCPATNPAGFEDLRFVLIEPGVVDLPGRKIIVEDAFCISDKEISRRDWLEVMKEEPVKKTSALDLPVTDITLQQAQAFAAQLGERDLGVVYRLPTDREWEYAARAGAKTDFWFGDDPEELYRYGNCENRGVQDGYDVPAPVGSLRPNPWGLFDVHGNVAELVVSEAPLEKGRTLRLGGSSENAPSNCSFKNRSKVKAAHERYMGFRVLRELEPAVSSVH